MPRLARANKLGGPTVQELSRLAYSDMSDATRMHYELVKAMPLYWETRMWFPIVVPTRHDAAAAAWLFANGYQRGTTEARNDWLTPYAKGGKTLFLIRDEEVAILFKLKWS
jgi:hypothetical protein